MESITEETGAALLVAINRLIELMAPITRPSSARRPTVASVVLKLLDEARPKTMRVADLRAPIEFAGFNVHEKTIGMTLYRLAKAGMVQRVGGWEWRSISPENRP